MSFQCYLKTHRRRLGLTQRELGILLGFESESMVCRYEGAARKPDLEIALACQIIFGVAPHEMFPGVYAPVEQIVMERVLRLAEMTAREKSSPRRMRTLAALDTIIERAKSTH